MTCVVGLEGLVSRLHPQLVFGQAELLGVALQQLQHAGGVSSGPVPGDNGCVCVCCACEYE